jgi:2-dehydropantoate 2-reductase
LKILSFGAGAIGTYIGGSLALYGHQVVFLERPGVADLLLKQGISLQIASQTFNVAQPVICVSLPEALAHGPFDLGLVAMKSYDTAAAVEEFAPFCLDLPPLLCLQNGVENEIVLAQSLGPEKVIAGTVTSSITRAGVGSVVLEKLRGMGVAGGHPLSNSLVDALSQAGLNARLYARPADMKWSKLLTNLLGNATSAILDMPPAEIYAHAGLFKLERDQFREALAVMRSMHIGVVDLPSTPVRALVFALDKLPRAAARRILIRAVGSGRGAKMPSFHIDLHQGRGQSEVEFLNGAVERFGNQAGVFTPANRLLTETLLALTRGELPLDEYRRQPEKLLKRYAGMQTAVSP